MNININSFSSHTISFFQESFTHSLTSIQKRTLVVAIAVFTLLTTYYILKSWCSKADKRNAAQNKINIWKEKDFSPNETKKIVIEGLKEEQSLLLKTNKVQDKKNTQLDDKSNEREIKFPDGRIARGNFQQEKPLNGVGKVIYPNERVEKGTFQDDELIEGEMIYLSGTIIQGKFKNRTLNGEGKITNLNGMNLEGYFEAGFLNGQGKITCLEGPTWIGQFKYNLLNGPGKEINSKGKIKEGIFKNGIFMDSKII